MIASSRSAATDGRSAAPRGFTLVELATVLFIVALLLGGLMYTLSAQTEQRARDETARRLNEARELLVSFAIVNGRLPCPASATTNGEESPVGGACTNYYTGFVPARAIGMQGQDAFGYALDAWGNRLRYAVSSVGPNNHFTTKVSLQTNGVATAPNDLVICAAWGGSAANCNTATPVTNQNVVAAVIWSQGKNFSTVGAGGDDETANNKTAAANNHPVFVWHDLRPVGATGGEYDDMMVWIPAGLLYGRLVSAGVLP
jgi:prepilin-type N-terminal cleavage/methylation domain-containing protein